MKIEKIIENNDMNKYFTAASAYAILSLINNRINNKIMLNDKIIIDEIFMNYGYDSEYDKYINIANKFVNENLDGYHPNIEDTQELKTNKY